MEFAAAEKITAFDFLPRVAASTSPPDFFLDYDHLSKAGHEQVAGWLAALPEIVGQAPDPDLAIAPPEAVREFSVRRVRSDAASLASGPGSALAPVRDAVIEQAVDDPSPRVRFEAAQTAFALGPPGKTSIDALVRGVRHEDPRVRAFATWTLGEMGETARPAIPALVTLARQDGGAGKTGALSAIGKIGGDFPETIPLLLQELKHPKEARRYRAARTIGRMGPAASAAVSGLTEALRDPSPLVRLHAVRALGNLADPAKASVPALIELLNQDPDQDVRKEVSLTLSRLPGR
jgi:HEAT repeat protein